MLAFRIAFAIGIMKIEIGKKKTGREARFANSFEVNRRC